MNTNFGDKFVTKFSDKFFASTYVVTNTYDIASTYYVESTYLFIAYGPMAIRPYMAKNGHIWPYGHMAIGPYPKKIWASGASPERPIKM